MMDDSIGVQTWQPILWDSEQEPRRASMTAGTGVTGLGENDESLSRLLC